MSPYFALYTVENNKNKKSVKFQGDMLNFYDFIQVFVFTRNHHLKSEFVDKLWGSYFKLSYFPSYWLDSNDSLLTTQVTSYSAQVATTDHSHLIRWLM